MTQLPVQLWGGVDTTAHCQVVEGDSPTTLTLSSSIVIAEDVSVSNEISTSEAYDGPVIEMFPTPDVINVPDLVVCTDDDSTSESASIVSNSSSDTDSVKGMDLSDLLVELNIPSDPSSPSKLSDKQIQQINKACIESLEKNGCITVSLLNWM